MKGFLSCAHAHVAGAVPQTNHAMVQYKLATKARYLEQEKAGTNMMLTKQDFIVSRRYHSKKGRARKRLFLISKVNL